MGQFFDSLRLHLLLRVIGALLSRATKTSVRLKQMLTEENFIFQIRTSNGAGGHFVLKQGHLRYHAGVHSQPDFAQIWRTPREAIQAMTSSDESAMLRAFDAGACRMEGRFLVALWFNEAMKLARPK